MYIAYLHIPKSFLILIVNSNNCLYYNIIIYKFDMVILKILIERLFLFFYCNYFKFQFE